MENEYITADQLNTVFKRDRKNKKNKHCAQDFDSNHVHQTFLSLRDIFKSSGSACAHTQHISPAFYWTAQQGVNLATHVPAHVSLRCRLIYLGRCFLRLNGPSREEQRYHRLNQTTGVLVRLHLSRCSLKRDGSQLRFEFL